MSKNTFGLYINLEERGEFNADVRDSKGTSIFEIKFPVSSEEIGLIEFGYMRQPKDIEGLTSYLREMQIIGKEDRILSSSEFETLLGSAPSPADQQSSLRDLEANFCSAIRNREVVKIGGGEFTSNEINPVHALLYASNEGQASPYPGFTEDERSDVQTFLSNLKKAVFDRDTVTISGGQFNRADLQALKAFLTEQSDQFGSCPAGPSI